MRRTLIVVSFLVIAVAMTTPVLADLNWSSGITLTEKESGIQIGSRIEAMHGRYLIGCWFSSSGQLPVMVQGLGYNAFGDFPGINKIQKVVLSPDHGKTEWPADQIEGKGYFVPIPNLLAGGYGLEWGVTSKDKHNRLLLVIIPINWSSTRSSSATNHAMVQMAPMGYENFSDQQWYACLRGFVPAWATVDPSYAALVQASQPPVQQVVPQSEKEAVVETTNFDGEVTLILDYGKKQDEFPVNITADISVGQKIVFRRSGRFVAEAEITDLMAGKFIQARVIKGGYVQSQDGIFLGGK